MARSYPQLIPKVFHNADNGQRKAPAVRRLPGHFRGPLSKGPENGPMKNDEDAILARENLSRVIESAGRVRSFRYGNVINNPLFPLGGENFSREALEILD